MFATVTENDRVTRYFCCMDSSVHFLLGIEVPAPEGATIHSIAPPPLAEIDDDKIAFTLDVAMRLDQEQSSIIFPIGAIAPEELADTA